jgi:16S rRNA (adenine1518-N6/adenine1519-N6)-dimethyltransferase
MKNPCPAEAKSFILTNMNHQAKKSLGQNFLHSKKVLRDIAEAGKITKEDTVLEIGPGKGALTVELLARAEKVICIEKDDRLIEFLKEKFSADIQSGKLTIIHGDILEIPIASLSLSPRNYKLIANIPYYITGAIFKKFLEEEAQPSTMVLLVQKEVAERVVARDGKESILSMSVKAYGVPRYVGKVSAGNFVPVPNVDSAILAVENISKSFLEGISEKDFFEILKTGFAHKRKQLLGNLKNVWEKIDQKILDEAGVAEKTRAEDLNFSQWKKLVQIIKSKYQ